MQIVYRRGSKNPTIYYYDPARGKQVQLPRKFYAHLDGQPEEELKAWADKWADQHGIAKDRAERTHLSPDDELAKLWDHYQKSRTIIRNRRQITQDMERLDFYNHIVPFFVNEKGEKDPAGWHKHVPAFHTALFDQKMAVTTVRQILWTLGRFGKFLVFQRRMTFPYAIQVPAKGRKSQTPLQVRVSPEVVLAYDGPFQLAVLLGYFASLRPSELWALTKEDFLTGAAAEEKTKTLVGLRACKLGSKLSVKIVKALHQRGDTDLLKTDYSYGVVNIWHPDAAKKVATMLKALPDGRLFLGGRSWLDHQWKRDVTEALGVTAHDLRRASGLYLGRVVRIPLTLLQEHMRHSDIQTTMLYIREPLVDEDSGGHDQDFDDIV